MKRTAVFLVTLLLLTCSASAHPGRTDANGGHHVGGTSEYHYHHGYPAHQHINGVCPYGFDDKTGSNSGSSSGSNSGSSTTTKPSTTATVSDEEDTKTSVWYYISIGFLSLLFGWPVLCWVAAPVVTVVDSIKERKRKLARRDEEARRFNEERSYYIGLYAGKTIEELCDMPPDTEIGEDGLPKIKGCPGWGSRYTFYVSRSGQAFHNKSTCTAFSNIKIHAWNTRRYTPCKRCKPLRPDLCWFTKYQQIQSICRTYNIILPILAPIEPPQPESALPSPDHAERPEA